MLGNIQITKTIDVEKKKVNKLVEECTENVADVKLAKVTLAEDENKYKKKMQFLHTVHCIIFNNLYNQHWNWGYFVYSKYVNLNKDIVAKENFIYQTIISLNEL